MVEHQLKDRLNLLLATARISKSELARVAGLNLSIVTKLCLGRTHNVTLDTALRIADATGASLDWLAGRPVVGPKPVVVRHHFACKGGRVMGAVAEPADPINVMNGAGQSRRGRVRSVLISSAPAGEASS